jgi:hypothetical protein
MRENTPNSLMPVYLHTRILDSDTTYAYYYSEYYTSPLSMHENWLVGWLDKISIKHAKETV